MGFSEPVGRFYVAVGMDTSELRAEISRANRVMRKALGSEAIALSQDLAKAVAASAAGLAALGVAAVKMAADMEQVEVGFTTILKSASAAKMVMKDIQAFAASTPFEFGELAPAARSLLAFGVSAGDLIPTLTNLGNIASGIGQPIGEIAEIYGKARVQGRLFMEDINQLTGRGIPIIQELAKQFKVTEGEVRNLVEKGRVNFGNLQQAITSLSTGTGLFAGGMQAQSQTINGLLSTLRDDVITIMRDIGSEIAKALDLQGVIKSMSESIGKIRQEYANSGRFLVDPFSKSTYAVVGLSAAIAGALIPSLQLLKGWAVVSLVPLLPLAAKVAAVALVLYGLFEIAYKLYESRGQISAFFEVLSTGARMAYNSIREGLANLMADFISIIRTSIQDSQIAQYLAEPLAKMQVAFHQMAQESRNNVKTALEEQTRACWVLAGQYDGVTSSIVQMIRASGDWRTMLQSIIGQISQVIPAVGALAKIMGQAATTYKPAAAPAPTPIPGGGKKGTDLAREAKSISDSIKSEWMQATKDEETILNAWYDKQLEQLNKSKAASKTYHDDLIRLKETYLSKVRDIAERENEEAMRGIEERRSAEAALAAQRGEALRRQIEEENAEAQKQAERLEEIRTGQALEKQLWDDYRASDLQSYMAHLNAKNAAFLQSLRGQQEAMSLYRQLSEDAHRSSLSYMVEGYQTLYTGLTDALVGVITGSKSAAQAMKELGMQLITMVVKWMVQRQLAATMSKGLEKAMTASSVASAALTAKAWAPAAAMVAAATFGASTATAAAGLTALSGLSRALAIPGLAKGGIVTSPTLAMIGEGKGPEAVIPLDRLGNMGGETRVTVNVHNNTGTPTQARQQTTRNGQEVVVDLFLDAFARDVNGLRTVLKGA